VKNNLFTESLKFGDIAEDYVKGILEDIGFVVSKNTAKTTAELAKWDLLIEDTDTRLEVKHDKNAYRTRNYFIETSSWGRDNTGILATTADFYVFVIEYPMYKFAHVYKTSDLKEAVAEMELQTFLVKDKHGKATLDGLAYLLPMERLKNKRLTISDMIALIQS
jgi:hypothetical protein